MSKDDIGVWLKVNETTYMCSNCKAIVTVEENIKYQRFCYWCGKQLMPIIDTSNLTNS